MGARATAGWAVGATFVAGVSACSLLFPPGDLTSGSGDATGGHGGQTSVSTGSTMTNSTATTMTSMSSTTGGGGGCKGDADCDDGNPCTSDVCKAHVCEHEKTPGATCGAGNGCTPAPRCDADGVCQNGQPDDSLCDDGNACTLDTCAASGCMHSANTGANCNDGNMCDAAGTCNGQGKCVGAAIMPQELCSNQACPGGYYVSSYTCNSLCGSCPLCINAAFCSFGCEPSMVACCNIGTGDCSAACPAGYSPQGAVMMTLACGCVSANAPSKAITCVRN